MSTEAIIHLAAQVRERANALIVAELERRGAAGLAPSHGAILVQLYRQGPLPMTRLVGLIGRKKNTLTATVAWRRWVEKVWGPGCPIANERDQSNPKARRGESGSSRP
jgi:hypothetical protein